jgi:hypothetical protein
LGCQSHLPEQGASTQLLRPLHCLMPIPSPLLKHARSSNPTD